MPRRLNIERRRKRIRHYTARRRRRSPVRRALTYWWGTLAVGVPTALMRGGVAFGFATRRPFVVARPLPQAGLSLIVATEAEVSGIVRTGNARRLATALGDTDIGISLAPSLPEPAPIAPPPLPPPAGVPTREAGPGEAALALLPAFAEAAPAKAGKAQGIGTQARIDAALAEVGFAVGGWPVSDGQTTGSAWFWLELDAEGYPETVLRLSPTGAENHWLRQLRTALSAGRGNGGARGTVTVVWGPEEGR